MERREDGSCVDDVMMQNSYLGERENPAGELQQRQNARWNERLVGCANLVLQIRIRVASSSSFLRHDLHLLTSFFSSSSLLLLSLSNVLSFLFSFLPFPHDDAHSLFALINLIFD